MAKYKIADIIVEIKFRYPEAEFQYEPYLYLGDEEPELILEADIDSINYFVTEGVDISPQIAENMVLGIRCAIHTNALVEKILVNVREVNEGR